MARSSGPLQAATPLLGLRPPAQALDQADLLLPQGHRLARAGLQVAARPGQQDGCYACHDTHGSDYEDPQKLLPPEFYIEYKTENYAICWDCHNKDMALTEVTTTLTGFRNGGRNSHSTSTRRPRLQGLPHAGDQEKHIREGPLQDRRQLPVKF
jgi:hypothetical protein